MLATWLARAHHESQQPIPFCGTWAWDPGTQGRAANHFMGFGCLKYCWVLNNKIPGSEWQWPSQKMLNGAKLDVCLRDFGVSKDLTQPIPTLQSCSWINFHEIA